jgi:hypothetical protein
MTIDPASFFKTIWFFLTITDTQNNTFLNQILQNGLWAWRFRPSITSDLITIITLLTLIVTIYIILSRQLSITHVFAPSPYTVRTNISLWLGLHSKTILITQRSQKIKENRICYSKR